MLSMSFDFLIEAAHCIKTSTQHKMKWRWAEKKKTKRLYVFKIFFWFRQRVEKKHACLFVNSSIRGFVIVAILIAVHELNKMNGRDTVKYTCLWIQSNEIISLVII